ncbi:MAG: DUF3800 domain-containing protein [Thermoanaerobaculia bacterium]
MQRERIYRLYIDESGDHTFKLAADDNHRFLGLIGIWFDADEPYRAFARALKDLKLEAFGGHPDDLPICLHRKDIIERRRVFGRLRDPELNQRFEAELLRVIGEAEFRMSCAVFDKRAHQLKACPERNPYHYSMAALLECFAGWLHSVGARGDVMAESRGASEDRELLEVFESTLRDDATDHLQRALTSGKIKLKKKEHAIPGLELADLLAYPFKREMIAEQRGLPSPSDFSARLLDAARPKMHCQSETGKLDGYGKIWLD